jgi:hypothetical protein
MRGSYETETIFGRAIGGRGETCRGRIAGGVFSECTSYADPPRIPERCDLPIRFPGVVISISHSPLLRLMCRLILGTSSLLKENAFILLCEACQFAHNNLCESTQRAAFPVGGIFPVIL